MSSSFSWTFGDRTPNQSSSTSLSLADSASRPTSRPTHSLNRQRILEEDDYTAAMSAIIARDFFPSLSRLEATNDFLESVERRDEVALEASVRRLIEVDQGRTPRFEGPSDTPVRTPRSDASGFSRSVAPDPTDGLSLDSFQARYTSEDNASFTQILHGENKKRKERYSWAYEAETKSKLLKGAERETMRKLIESGTVGAWEARERKRMEETQRRLEGKPGWMEIPAEKRLALEVAPPLSMGKDTGKGNERKAIMAAPLQPLAKKPRLQSDDVDEVDRILAGEESRDEARRTEEEEEEEEGEREREQHQQLVVPTSSVEEQRQLVSIASSPFDDPPLPPADLPLDPESHLAKALVSAGLPSTAVDAEAAEARRVAVGDVLAPVKDERSGNTSAWEFKTRNALMFGPDANNSPYEPATTAQSSSTSTLKLHETKSINHANTRLTQTELHSASSSEPPSPSHSRVAAAISGTPYHSNSSIPSVGGYPLVPHLPSPTPSSLGPERLAQLMTWGTLLSTPRAISSSEDEHGAGGQTPFRIADPSRRDNLGRKLASQASRSIADRAKGITPRSLSSHTPASSSKGNTGRAGEMLPPSWTTPRALRPGSQVELSPAGRGLLARAGAGGLGGGGLGLGGGGAMTPGRRGLPGLSSVSGHGHGIPGARRRGEVMERNGGWGGASKNSSGGKDVGKMRWSASPSPRVSRDSGKDY